MPDFHAHNMITERQVVNYGGTTSAAEAFFKVFFKAFSNTIRTKTFHKNPVERSFQMMWDHAHPWKLQNINGMFLGDFPDPSSPGPFSEAQNTFLLGGIIFLLAGAFDNENANLIKIIKKVKKNQL